MIGTQELAHRGKGSISLLPRNVGNTKVRKLGEGATEDELLDAYPRVAAHPEEGVKLGVVFDAAKEA